MNYLINKKNNLRQVSDKVPGSSKYMNILDDLLELFYQKDTAIVVDANLEKSRLEQTLNNHENRNFRLYIGISNRTEPLEVIWSLLHEYGHLLQRPPTDLEQTDGTPEKYEREKDAWRKAEDKFTEYSALCTYFDNFQAYREFSESSYKPK
ncbi:hypothetical protein ACFQRK_09375 [Parapedobacter sp. GCM10030251]|uniref:hypothetical protein n=1 Tax=Parapedobacter sp. GCM10030251 TaxID=3273419 RepID=UPI00360654A1